MMASVRFLIRESKVRKKRKEKEEEEGRERKKKRKKENKNIVSIVLFIVLAFSVLESTVIHANSCILN